MLLPNPIGCAKCGRKDVRLYRSYSSFRRDEEIVCNAHLPDDCHLGWWVPCIFDYSDEGGSIWGYTTAKTPDIINWRALPDTRFGPYWSDCNHWEASKSTYETALEIGDREDDKRRLKAAATDTRSYPKCRHSAQDWWIDKKTGDMHCSECEEETT